MSGTYHEIKQRLSSVKETRQMTNAMYLLSAARLKKAMRSMEYTLEYNERLRGLMTEILAMTETRHLHNIYLERSPKGRPLIMCVMGDKGLCGSYNSDVAALTLQTLSRMPDAAVCCFGHVGYDFLRGKGVTPIEVFPGASMHPEFDLAERISRILMERYLTDKYNEVYIIYTPFSRKGKLRPVCFRLLPLMGEDFTDLDLQPRGDELFAPTPEAVFEHIVPIYCAALLYNLLVQASASENSARMEAMQSACENADEMIYSLSVEMNMVRQLTITNEISEIAAAAEARTKTG
jgi:F-type H+-transporting ATPase subunit gamma